jgi:predicted transcriptional regulator
MTILPTEDLKTLAEFKHDLVKLLAEGEEDVAAGRLIPAEQVYEELKRDQKVSR